MNIIKRKRLREIIYGGIAGQIKFNIYIIIYTGSIGFICQPIGSIISGTVLEPLGRRNSMLLVNIPHLIGWCLFYYGISVPILFFAAVMMGLGKVIMQRVNDVFFLLTTPLLGNYLFLLTAEK